MTESSAMEVEIFVTTTATAFTQETHALDLLSVPTFAMKPTITALQLLEHPAMMDLSAHQQMPAKEEFAEEWEIHVKDWDLAEQTAMRQEISATVFRVSPAVTVWDAL